MPPLKLQLRSTQRLRQIDLSESSLLNRAETSLEVSQRASACELRKRERRRGGGKSNYLYIGERAGIAPLTSISA